MTQIEKPAPDKNGSAATKARKAEREVQARADVKTAGGDKGEAILPFDPWARASHVAMIGLFVIALLWCGFVAQPVIVPVLLGWAIATIVLPLVKYLQKMGVPRVVAAITVTVLLVTLIVSLLALLSTPVAYWLGRATEVGALIKEKLQMVNQPLALLGELQKALTVIGSGGSAPALKVEQSATVFGTIFSVLTPAVSEFVLFIGALVFYLVYQQRLRSTALHFVRDREARLATLRTLSDIDEHMTTYFGTFTIVNFCLGVVTVGLTWSVGLPNPLLWGVLAAVLNYIPYIGPAIVTGDARGGRAPDLSEPGRGPDSAGGLSRLRHDRGTVPDAGPDGAAARAQSVRGVPGHRLLHLALGCVRRLPGSAAADGADRGLRSRLLRGSA